MITREEILEYAKEICTTNGETVVAACIIDKIYFSIDTSEKTDDKKDPWDWVKTEYCALFKARNHAKGGYITESVNRMKKMFSAMPEIRKEDVINTVKLYLSKTDPNYIRFPHYFLKKGQGDSAVYEFMNWYEIYKESVDAGEGRDSVTNTMQ